MIAAGFYAPMKAPDHPNPSGDRELARGLMTAVAQAGIRPDLASDLRSLDMAGDPDWQAARLRDAQARLPGLVARGEAEGWRVWITYHNYYKAPDLLGPAVSGALGIPYVQIESTRARKRVTGPWAIFAEVAEAAADRADLILYFTERDAGALRAYGPPGQRLVHLRPFLHRDTLPPASDRSAGGLTVAMMRPGDKLASYRRIAAALGVAKGDWTLDIAGDGAAREEVETLMAPFGDRIRWHGAVSGHDLTALYARARFFLWPGVNEAIGMACLEAQAAGVPVIAEARPGLRDSLAPGLPYPPADCAPEDLAALIDAYTANPPPAGPLRAHIAAGHLRPAAVTTLRDALAPLL